MIWIVNLAGLGLMAAIVWWFWLARPGTTRRSEGTVEIVVDDGVYNPSRIEAPLNQPITLRFLRKDPSPCAEQVVFADFGVSAELPVNEYKDVELVPDKKGEFDFTCQMQMYRGKLIVT